MRTDKINTLRERLRELHESMPNYFHYFPDHGIKHVDRITEKLKKEFLPRLRIDPPLTAFEEYVLLAAVELHDVGMANPRTKANPSAGVPEDQVQLRAIRDAHEQLSRDFVNEFWRELGIGDRHVARLIAQLCYSHRRRNYVRDVFPHSLDRVGSESVRPQLLSALLKLGDALDTDYRRARETAEHFFLNLPEEDRWHWNACESVRGVSFLEHRICLELSRPDHPAEHDGTAFRAVKAKARAILGELFPVLPFTVPAGLPWVMVAVRSDQKEDEFGGKDIVDMWDEWWFDELRAEKIEFGDVDDVALPLRALVHPTMKPHDVAVALRAIRDRGYPVPPPVSMRTRSASVLNLYESVSTIECRRSFLDSLQCAQEHIELLSTDGLTFPREVYDILAQKLLARPCVKVTVFCLAADVLYELQKSSEGLTLEAAERQLQEAKAYWQNWWENDVVAKAPSREAELRGAFQVILVTSAELGHLNGSVLVDRKLLRLNVHRLTESSSRGVLLHCPEPVNLLSVVDYYIHDMGRFGKRWVPAKARN